MTPQEKKAYPGTTQLSGGTVNVGLGQPVYLEAFVTKGTVVTGVLWTLAGKPTGSLATLQASPLTNTTYDAGDRETYDVVDRRQLVPDVVCNNWNGDYRVTVKLMLTNKTITATNTFYGATYLGENYYLCVLCHADKTNDFLQTKHATAFTRKINGEAGSRFKSTCISCHALGYDATAGATNGGFDDVMLQTGWLFPTNLGMTNMVSLPPGWNFSSGLLTTNMAATNWAALPQTLKDKSNIQCESCHGPASRHSAGLGDTNAITVSLSSGNCGQCHDSMTHHAKNYELGQTLHATGSLHLSGSCLPCHSTKGFIDAWDSHYADAPGVTNTPRGTAREGITCAACHDPHSSGTGLYQLRSIPAVTLANGAVVTKGGNGLLCMACHHDRRNSEVYVLTSKNGPHHGTQGDMLMGTNGIQYGMSMPSSQHRDVVSNSCVECHMQVTPAGMDTNALNRVGGHTFRIGWTNSTVSVRLTDACADCHGAIPDFNFGGADFDQDGVVEGVQKEISDMLYNLAALFPPHDGVTIDSSGVSATNAADLGKRKAIYNHNFVKEDGSLGIHNAKYAAALLRASIDDMKGGIDFDRDGILDSWERTSFGSITNQTGTGDADGDGLSNVQEMAVGTNPKLADTDGDGVSDLVEVMAGTNPLNPSSKPDKNEVGIISAVELAYLPQTPGLNQQFQSVSKSGGSVTWTNIGNPFISSNAWYYLLQSNRDFDARFYRVITKP
ncbi:MAG: hypothetical protein C0404_01440 [Verrucomicrobia bacterium]|nr:hypothetical protein [Verrucomicrobiota bacterium]